MRPPACRFRGVGGASHLRYGPSPLPSPSTRFVPFAAGLEYAGSRTGSWVIVALRVVVGVSSFPPGGDLAGGRSPPTLSWQAAVLDAAASRACYASRRDDHRTIGERGR